MVGQFRYLLLLCENNWWRWIDNRNLNFINKISIKIYILLLVFEKVNDIFVFFFSMFFGKFNFFDFFGTFILVLRFKYKILEEFILNFGRGSVIIRNLFNLFEIKGIQVFILICKAKYTIIFFYPT